MHLKNLEPDFTNLDIYTYFFNQKISLESPAVNMYHKLIISSLLECRSFLKKQNFFFYQMFHFVQRQGEMIFLCLVVRCNRSGPGEF